MLPSRILGISICHVSEANPSKTRFPQKERPRKTAWEETVPSPQALEVWRHFIEALRRGQLRGLGCRGRSGSRQVCAQEVGTELPLAFDLDDASAVARVTQGLQGPRRLLSHLQLEGRQGSVEWPYPCPHPPCLQPGSHLDLAENSRALHAAGHIHRVSPDVVLRLLRPNHPCYHWPVVQPYKRCGL